MHSSHPASISFTEEDLVHFSQVSGDRNPLHLDREYARSTPYGQRVVFGCLGAIKCLNFLRLPQGWRVTDLEAEFLRPMFLGVQYRLEVSGNEEQWIVRLTDGNLPMLSMTVQTIRSDRQQRTAEWLAGPLDRRNAVSRNPDDIVTGLRVVGVYPCNPTPAALSQCGWGDADRDAALALCWSSYLIGMELPGESALFRKLKLSFEVVDTGSRALSHRAAVVSVDPRFGQIKLEIGLTAPSLQITGQCWSFIRPPVPEDEDVIFNDVRPDALAGRVALLLGSSRGLGAAIKHALVSRGATVYGLSRSPSTDPRTIVGDASDPLVLETLRRRIENEEGRLNFLICNACPPILPLQLEPNAAERIETYIQSAVALTLRPLAEFLGLLNRTGGCAVIVSSAAVEHPVKEWPHYLAAKGAVEMLGQVAALQYPQVHTLIVRPPKMLTAMTNTPMGRLNAATPASQAHRIAHQLEQALEPGRVDFLK